VGGGGGWVGGGCVWGGGGKRFLSLRRYGFRPSGPMRPPPSCYSSYPPPWRGWLIVVTFSPHNRRFFGTLPRFPPLRWRRPPRHVTLGTKRPLLPPQTRLPFPLSEALAPLRLWSFFVLHEHGCPRFRLCFFPSFVGETLTGVPEFPGPPGSHDKLMILVPPLSFWLFTCTQYRSWFHFPPDSGFSCYQAPRCSVSHCRASPVIGGLVFFIPPETCFLSVVPVGKPPPPSYPPSSRLYEKSRNQVFFCPGLDTPQHRFLFHTPPGRF